MDDNVFLLPKIQDCKVEGGFDDKKGKSFIVLSYDGISLVEYFEIGGDNVEQRVTMSRVVQRCMSRMAVSLAAKKRKTHA